MSTAQVPEGTPSESTGISVTTQSSGSSPVALPIGGWLWLPALGLVLGAIRVLLESVKSVRSLLEREHLAAAASLPGLPHSTRSLTLLFVAGYQVALFVGLVWVGVRFARRKRNAPKLLIAVYLLNLASLGALYALGRSRFATPTDAMSAVTGVVIWVPYFLLSDRVKRTFLL